MRSVTSWLVGGLLGLGFAAGGYVLAVATVQAPPKCSEAFTAAEDALAAYDDAVGVVHLRATRGQSEFAGYEAELNAIWAELDELTPDYLAAKAACLGTDPPPRSTRSPSPAPSPTAPKEAP
ncbi:hypothetical protein [Promicromonospora sp. NPDC023805]|uniref:hypothetical protein n=1 Tax=Promicromonospora sp. NPDC023805 TaxID=3154696 RepID=UPI0033F12E80